MVHKTWALPRGLLWKYSRPHKRFPFEIFGAITLLAIIASEALKLLSFVSLHNSYANGHHLSAVLLGLLVIFAPITGAISDYHCRKTLLTFTLLASGVSAGLFHFGFVWPAVFTTGIFSNVLPVARAAYCDVHTVSSRKANIVNTFVAQAVPWIAIPLADRFIPGMTFLLCLIILGITLILTISLFDDFRDKAVRATTKLTDVGRKVLDVRGLKLIAAFLIWNTAWMMTLGLAERSLNQNQLDSYYFLVVGVAFFVGALFTRIFGFRPHKVLPTIFFGTFVIFFFAWVLGALFHFSQPNTLFSFLLFTVLGGTGIPLIFDYFGEKSKLHEQGRVFGALESVQFTSEFIAPIIVGFIPAATAAQTYHILIPMLLASAALTFRKGRG